MIDDVYDRGEERVRWKVGGLRGEGQWVSFFTMDLEDWYVC